MIHIQHVEDTPFHGVPFLNVSPARKVVSEVLPLYRATTNDLPPGIEALLVCGDLQGRAKPVAGRDDQRLLGEVLAQALVLLKHLGKCPPLDTVGVILAGDFYARPQMDRRGGSGDVRSVWQAFTHRCRWVAGVAGNHDVFGEKPSVPNFEEFCRQPKTHFLDGSVVELDSIKIAGLSGIVGNPKRPYRRLQSDYVDAVQTLCEAGPHILVLHDGPDFPSLGFKGNPVIREALENSRPTLVIRGHAHWETPLVTLTNGTQVLNVDARAVLVLRA